MPAQKNWTISFFPNTTYDFVLNSYKQIGALSQFLQQGQWK